MNLLLKHIGGTTQEVSVLSAARYRRGQRARPYLTTRWVLAGAYEFDLEKNQLLLGKGRIGLWSAFDVGQAWAAWVLLCPGTRDDIRREIPIEYVSLPCVRSALARRG
jgi:hypothetical protein